MLTLIERIEQKMRDGVATTHGPIFDGAYPALSESSLAKAEDTLGLHLPNLLKQLYLRVGNGGFGPGHGLLPLLPSGDLQSGNSVLNLYAKYQISKKWNRSIIPFNTWGCGILSCVAISDVEDPPVYRFEPNLPDDYTHDYLKGHSFVGVGLIPEELTLSEWLNEWLEGNADELFDRMNTI